MAQYTKKLEQLYVAYFNRSADPAGLAYWESIVASQGGNISAVSNSFSQSEEYKNTYAGMDNATIVNQVYRNLFGRESEIAGRNYWAQNLDAKNLTMDNVVTTISESARGTDLIAFNNKVTAATSLTTTLDTSAAASSYAGESALALARAYLSQVTDAESLIRAQKNDF
ncbi:MAG: DUF4214 domain-containing protein [Burkholderiales bacterium]|nr:DUF4214 domain-containing protein [Burkholderiales bacterium]